LEYFDMPPVCGIFYNHEVLCEIVQSALVDEVGCGWACAWDECLSVAIQGSTAGNVGNVAG
jgi:hypothetical protein